MDLHEMNIPLQISSLASTLAIVQSNYNRLVYVTNYQTGVMMIELYSHFNAYITSLCHVKYVRLKVVCSFIQIAKAH